MENIYIILKLKNGFIHLLNLGYDIQSWTILEKQNVCRSKQIQKKCFPFRNACITQKEKYITFYVMQCNAFKCYSTYM
jgi:hypothetical protein